MSQSLPASQPANQPNQPAQSAQVGSGQIWGMLQGAKFRVSGPGSVNPILRPWGPSKQVGVKIRRIIVQSIESKHFAKHCKMPATQPAKPASPGGVGSDLAMLQGAAHQLQWWSSIVWLAPWSIVSSLRKTVF